MSATIIANEIRATHHYAFRSGQWATLISATYIMNERLCYHVKFEDDGAEDYWPVCDKTHGYEFR